MCSTERNVLLFDIKGDSCSVLNKKWGELEPAHHHCQRVAGAAALPALRHWILFDFASDYRKTIFSTSSFAKDEFD